MATLAAWFWKGLQEVGVGGEGGGDRSGGCRRRRWECRALGGGSRGREVGVRRWE